ncbi:TIGR04086 family membrane protein [Aneurinibacillus danicus]|uniref:Putative membrane protein YrzE n=1 Tax=Aneurinibacillus danicus TaxID=267746 RepID=A0A511V5Q3_9BACL|nr:TIGR04086 family membrane protein [Aneurinibacillus danicus]GEN33073.1 putative membrane protein YrzE [Aneurinibacillus danicus]
MLKMSQIKLPMLAGFIYTFTIVLLGAVVTSLILAFTETRESSLPTVVYTVNGLALFVGGFVSGKRGGMKGWYYGGMTGILYSIFITLLSFLGFDAKLGISSLYHLLLAFLVAAVGGIIGVNLSKK